MYDYEDITIHAYVYDYAYVCLLGPIFMTVKT